MRLKNFTPTNDYILVQLHAQGTTKGGIILDTPQQDMWMKVLKTGPDMRHIKPGQYILVSHLSGMEMTFEAGENCILIQEAYVCATYKPDQKEKQPFYIPKPPPAPVPAPGRNIIDNPGIEEGSFLHETDA